MPVNGVVHVIRNHVAPALTLPNRTGWAKLSLAANRNMLDIMTAFANEQSKSFPHIAAIAELIYFRQHHRANSFLVYSHKRVPMVFFIKEDGVKNILIHTFILPSVEQKANLWNMHPDKLLFKNNFIKPYTMKK
jgi:hypothetical protein